MVILFAACIIHPSIHPTRALNTTINSLVETENNGSGNLRPVVTSFETWVNRIIYSTNWPIVQEYI